MPTQITSFQGTCVELYKTVAQPISELSGLAAKAKNIALKALFGLGAVFSFGIFATPYLYGRKIYQKQMASCGVVIFGQYTKLSDPKRAKSAQPRPPSPHVPTSLRPASTGAEQAPQKPKPAAAVAAPIKPERPVAADPSTKPKRPVAAVPSTKPKRPVAAAVPSTKPKRPVAAVAAAAPKPVTEEHATPLEVANLKQHFSALQEMSEQELRRKNISFDVTFEQFLKGLETAYPQDRDLITETLLNLTGSVDCLKRVDAGRKGAETAYISLADQKTMLNALTTAQKAQRT